MSCYSMQGWYLRIFFAFSLVFFAGPALAQASASASVPRSAIPFKQEKQGNDAMAYQSIAALLLASCAAYGIVLALKRYRDKLGGVSKATRKLRTLEAIRLGKSSMLYVVEYNGQELLLAESPQGVHLLSGSTVKPAEESLNSNA